MDKNIFESAGKQGLSQKKKAVVQFENRVEKSPQQPSVHNEEINIMLQKMQNMKLDLENQLTEIYRKGEESKINVSLLMKDAGSLTRQEIQKMEAQKKILEDEIDLVIPQESCLKRKSKSKEKMTQERKGKLRGARNNWIPVK